MAVDGRGSTIGRTTRVGVERVTSCVHDDDVYPAFNTAKPDGGYCVMEVVLVVLLAGAVTGVASWLLVLRWPGLDPAAPRTATRVVAHETARHSSLDTLIRQRTDPATATGLALTAAVALAAGGAIAIGALLVMVETNSGFARWDTSFGQWGADHATPASTTFLRDVSLLGGTAVTITLAVVVAVVELVRTHRRAILGFLVCVIGGITILLNVTKVIVERDRPDIRRLTGFSGASFPSGHAATAAAALAALALLLGLGRSHCVKAALTGLSVGLAVAIATTRVLLGVHWFTDVLAGLALGWAWFAVCSIAFGGRLLRFGAPIEAVERTEELADLSGHRSR
jgi:membrane-associated phospholipid phosphatase